MFDPQGCSLDTEEAAEYAELQWDDGIIADAFRHSNENNDSIDTNQSLYDFFIEKSNEMFTGEPYHTARRKRETLLLFARMWGSYIGSPVTQQSLKFFWLEECIGGENPFVLETYHKILEQVAKSALSGADIKFGHKVTKITAEGYSGKRRKTGIQTSDGVKVIFDDVVVTTPLGWLKRNQAAFEPPLPSRLAQAIDNIGYGTLDKVYITFPSAYWETKLSADPRSMNGVDPQGKTPNVKATTRPIHQPPAQKSVSRHASGALWLSPLYASQTNPYGWDQECLYLSALPESYAHPTLLFYIYGDCSRHIANLASSEGSPEKRHDKIVGFFKPYYSLLPNYNSSEPACLPTAVLATAWANDAFAGYGSYCNFQVGLDHADKDIETLRHGVPERGLWLAGEHTAPFISLGTTTGAYVSGESVARRILEAHSV